MYNYNKRIIDLILSIILLIALSPLFVLVSIAIKLDSPGPVFFKQKRVGINKTSFYIYKFRTMEVNAPRTTPTRLLSDPSQYITKIGRIIRKTSIDELPQIYNVLKGDMSLIGPRPVIFEEKLLIEEREKYNVYSILPGITGWAQINGRDNLGVYDKAILDGEYVKRRTLLFDIKIFLGTIMYVLRMDDVVEGLLTPSDYIKHEEQI